MYTSDKLGASMCIVAFTSFFHRLLYIYKSAYLLGSGREDQVLSEGASRYCISAKAKSEYFAGLIVCWIV